MIGQIPSIHANAIAPFAPLGRQPVGQESADLKNSTLKSLEETAESGYLENRRSPDDNPHQEDEQQRLNGQRRSLSTDAESDENQKADAAKKQEALDRVTIETLAARDREVRAHEQAHAAVGGLYAGNPVYSYTRGPDGVAYAVSGEVSISTSSIPGDPEATLAKARQIRQAAHAPAEPSPQDRQVAAAAARMEAEALAMILAQEPALPSDEVADGKEAVMVAEVDSDDGGRNREEAAGTPESSSSDGGRERLTDLNRRFHEMGVWAGHAPGQQLDRHV